jgi:RHS repeat-associated protein
VLLLKGGTNPGAWTGYDSFGNVVCESDPDRRVTSYAYDSTGTVQVRAVNAKGHVSSTQYYGIDGAATDLGRFGQVKKVTDPIGSVTTLEHDTFGRKTKEVRPPVGAPLAGDPFPGLTITTAYHLGGVGTNRVETATSAGEWTAEYFDGRGRTYLAKAKGSSLASARVFASRVTFNPTGTKRQTSLPYLFTTGSPRWTTFNHDARGRIVQTTNPDLTRNLTCYRDLDGSSATVDANDHRRRQVTDARGNLVRVQEYLGTHSTCSTEVGTPYATTQYVFDRMGRLTNTIDAAQAQFVTDYDTLGRKAFASDPDLGTWYYGYTQAGDVSWQQDANGTGAAPYKIHFEYDALHRRTLVDNPVGADETYVYDDPAVPYSMGRLTAIIDASGSTTHRYDAIGRPWKRTQLIDGVAYESTNSYDSAGRLVRETYPDASAAGYTYDADGFLGAVTTDAVTRATLTEYNALGQVGFVACGNGVTTRYAYNESGNNRVRSITTSRGASTLLSLTYDYDNARNVKTLADGVSSANTLSFGYDELNRLTSASSAAFGALAYGYGETGNILTKEGVSYTYDPIKVHAAKTTSDGRAYAYDANGNLLADGTRTIVYDFQNRPTSVTVSGSRAEFTYDGTGQRVKKQVYSGAGASTTIYFGRAFECTDGVCTRHVFAGDKRIASLRSDGTAQYFHADHLDSTRVVTDQAGAVVERIAYRPYGDAPAGTAKYRYTSKELDAETGLYFYGARYYNPVLGRFISPDPIGARFEDPQTLNRYAYARNNPVFFNDPSGYSDSDPGNLDGMFSDYLDGDQSLQVPCEAAASICPSTTDAPPAANAPAAMGGATGEGEEKPAQGRPSPENPRVDARLASDPPPNECAGLCGGDPIPGWGYYHTGDYEWSNAAIDFGKETAWAYNTTSDALSLMNLSPEGLVAKGAVTAAKSVVGVGTGAAYQVLPVSGYSFGAVGWAVRGARFGAAGVYGAVALKAGIAVGSPVTGLMLMPPLNSYYVGLYRVELFTRTGCAYTGYPSMP